LKVLIIEDDPQIVEAINLAFQIRWPEAKVITTSQGESGVDLVESKQPDVVILDLGLPDISGFDVLKRIRLFSSVPILILTVAAEETDKVKGLEWGADDYVTKPFKQLELLARIKALLRRQNNRIGEQPVVYGKLTFNPSTYQLTSEETDINITRTEGLIINHLMRNAGHVVTHASLAEAVWGTDYPDSAQSLKVYIRRLREKLEDDPGDPRLILTKPGIGYFLAKFQP
jgi:two-component system, OmpR family, response regulator VicR